MKAPSTQQGPTSGQFPSPGGMVGRPGLASEPKLAAGAGSRGGCRAGLPHTPPSSPQEPLLPPLHTGLGSLLAGFIFCWLVFCFFRQQLS